MPLRLSTRPSDARGRRSSAFVRKDWGQQRQSQGSHLREWQRQTLAIRCTLLSLLPKLLLRPHHVLGARHVLPRSG